MRVTRPKRCSCAPPLVPVARISTTRIRRWFEGAGRGFMSKQGSSPGIELTSDPTSNEQALDGLVDGAPLIFVRFVAAQEVHPSRSVGQTASDVGIDEQDAWRQVACVWIHAGVVIEDPVGRVEVDARRDPPLPDHEGRQAQGAARAEQLEESSEEDPTLLAAEGRREQAVRTPALLVKVDEDIQVAQWVARFLQADLAD